MDLKKLRDKLWRKMTDDPKSLIQVLLDTQISWAERDDAATYLYSYDEPEVEEALFKVASNPDENGDIAESCGECVAEIWCRKDELNLDKLQKLKPAALKEAIGIISVRKPQWMTIIAKVELTRFQ